MNERDLGRHVRAIREQIEWDVDEHPDLELELFPYADGSLHSESIDAHLRACTRCAEDVRDLRGGAVRRSSRIPYLLLAAAVAVMVITALLVRREEPAPPTVFRPAPPVVTVPPAAADEWEPLRRAARAGKLPSVPPVLRKMPRAEETLRGGSAASGSFAPSGIVVESQQPLLTWSAAEGERSVVSIFAGGEEVVRSGSLRGGRWKPPHPLRRGVTYSWEVRVEKGDSVRILPAPPAPPAVFHVLDAAAHAELERARTTRGDDRLLLALLCARAGLIEQALEEAERVKGPDRVAADRLRQEVRSW